MRVKFPQKILNFLAVLHIKFLSRKIKVGLKEFSFVDIVHCSSIMDIIEFYIVYIVHYSPFSRISLCFETIFLWFFLFRLLEVGRSFEKNDYCNKFLSININLSIKYNSGIHIKFKVPWQLLSDCGSFFTSLYQLFTKIIIENAP